MTAAHRAPCEEGVIRAAGPAGPTLGQARKRWILAATVLASSMAFIDGSVVNVALPTIQRSLGADGAATSWVMNAYLLMLGALILAGGAAADRFGRRRVLLTGVLVFTAASILCGLALSPGMLIAARAVQGAGAALLTPASLAILGSSFGDDERGQAIGAWAGFGAVTSAIGPVLGGWLVDSLSWRAIFLINVPLAMATVAIVLAAVPESGDPEAKGLDLAGALLAIAGLGLLTWALTAAPAAGFGSPWVLAGLAAGVAALAAFVAVELRASAPMTPPELFRSLDFSGANLLTLFLYFAMGGALFFLPFELIRVRGFTATQAGAALLPFALIMGLFSSLAGKLADRLGPRLQLTAGPLVAGLGLVLLGLGAGHGGFWTGVLPGLLVQAAGMTLAVAPLTATVMAAVPRSHAGTASGINTAVARVAGLMAVALMTLVFAAAFDRSIQARLALAGLGSAAPPPGAALTIQPAAAGSAIASAERRAFDDAFRLVMFLAAAAAAAGGVAGGLLVGRDPLKGAQHART